MKVPTTMSTALATAASVANLGFVGIVCASTASADQATDASTHGFGSRRTLGSGDVVQGWTISDLKPSTDAIPYPAQGTLWEASATDEAINGYVIPIVPNLVARAPSGQTYPALYQVATPQGVNPATLAQGQKTTGKVYFDVIGDKPDGVVYSEGGQDLASWVNSQALQGRSGAGVPAGPVSRPVPAPVAPAAPALPAAPPAPAATPVALGGQQLPVGSPATPDPARSQGTRVSGSQGTPMPANSPAPSAPAGGQDAPAGSPALPAPAGGADALPGSLVTPPAGLPSAPARADIQGSAGSPAAPAPRASAAPPAPQTSPAPAAPAGGQDSLAASPAPAAPAGGEQVPPGMVTPPAGPPAAPAPAGSQGSAGSPATPTP